MTDPIVTAWLRDTRDAMRAAYARGATPEELADELEISMRDTRDLLDATPERLEEYLTGVFLALSPCEECGGAGYVEGIADIWVGGPGGYHTTEDTREECVCVDTRWRP